MAVEEAPPEAEKDRSERWLLTYADLITLLLIFFIIMYVFSTQDVVKYAQMATSLNQAFVGTNYLVGSAPGSRLIGGAGAPGKGGRGTEAESMERIEERVEELARKQGIQSGVAVASTEEGVIIRLSDQLLFQPGRADLSDQARRILLQVGAILAKEVDHYIRVEGHTDAIPMFSLQYPSNWELSAARASSVVRSLVGDGGLDPRLLWVAGYGEFRPIAGNDTDEGRKMNRRVEIIVLKNKARATRTPPRR